MNARMTAFTMVVVILAVLGRQAYADPLPGEILKFSQLPLASGVPGVNPYTGPYLPPPFTNGLPIAPQTLPGAPFPGHDETSTAYFGTTPNGIGYNGQFMADDFADNFTTPVVHVTWWGSYEGTAGRHSARSDRF